MSTTINTLNIANLALRQGLDDVDCFDAFDNGPPGRRLQEVKLARHLKGPWQTNIFSPACERLLRGHSAMCATEVTQPSPARCPTGGLAGPDFPRGSFLMSADTFRADSRPGINKT